MKILSSRLLWGLLLVVGGILLLLDTFGVPWKDAVSQPGFRLPSDKIVLK